MSSLRFRFRAFFKRHHKLVPVIGTLIVFFTFIVREELGEGWKTTAAEIDHAQELYQNRVETQAIQKAIDEERNTLNRLDINLRGSKLPVLKDLIGIGEETLNDVRASLEETASLLNRMKDATEERKELDHYREELQKGLSEGSHLTNEVRDRKPDEDIGKNKWVYQPRVPNNPLDDFLYKPDDNSLISHIQYYRSAAQDLQRDVTSLNENVLMLAKQVRETNKKKSDYASFTALGFFVLGSTLGILGKLYGVEAESGSGE